MWRRTQQAATAPALRAKWGSISASPVATLGVTSVFLSRAGRVPVRLLSSSLGQGTDDKGHAALVKKEFAKQAQRNYDNQPASSDVMLSWARANLESDLQTSFRVLDVAAGTGRMSRLVAPSVKEVVAVDLTEEMMAVGKDQARAAGINNIHWIVSKAQEMPFNDNVFDMVVSRLAVHHWDEPQKIVSEMARVCKPGGKVVLIDIVTPANLTPAQGDHLNHLERLRDPSHIAFWRLSELSALLERAKPALSPLPLVSTKENEVWLDQWMELTNTPPADREVITQAIEADMNGERDATTGYRPYRGADGRLRFFHSYVFLAAHKV